MLQVALLGKGAVHPARTRLVIGVGKVDILEIYDTATGAGMRVRGPFGWDLTFRNVGGTPMPVTRHRAYIDVATTDRAIYALFSGQPPEEEDISDAGCLVLVFSYEGALQAGYRLDACGTALAASRDGDRVTLYLAALSPEPGIRIYHLPAE